MKKIRDRHICGEEFQGEHGVVFTCVVDVGEDPDHVRGHYFVNLDKNPSYIHHTLTEEGV